MNSIRTHSHPAFNPESLPMLQVGLDALNDWLKQLTYEQETRRIYTTLLVQRFNEFLASDLVPNGSINPHLKHLLDAISNDGIYVDRVTGSEDVHVTNNNGDVYHIELIFHATANGKTLTFTSGLARFMNDWDGTVIHHSSLVIEDRELGGVTSCIYNSLTDDNEQLTLLLSECIDESIVRQFRDFYPATPGISDELLGQLAQQWLK